MPPADITPPEGMPGQGQNAHGTLCIALITVRTYGVNQSINLFIYMQAEAIFCVLHVDF